MKTSLFIRSTLIASLLTVSQAASANPLENLSVDMVVSNLIQNQLSTVNNDIQLKVSEAINNARSLFIQTSEQESQSTDQTQVLERPSAEVVEE